MVKRKYNPLLFSGVLVSASFLFSTFCFLLYLPFETSHQQVCSHAPSVDLVVTWVNGSDPTFLINLHRHYERFTNRNTSVKGGGAEVDSRRYLDSEELRFSLRSIEKNLCWVRTIYIVTNGQVPYWLDTQHPKIKLVRHDHIFEDLDDLPTFSSPAIEANIHRIPGLSELFIYINDDIIFTQECFLGDFFSLEKGQKVWLSYGLPYFNPSGDAYALSANFVNELYDKMFGMSYGRKMVAHGPVVLQKSVLEACHRDFRQYWRETSSHRFRMARDMQFSFSYVHYLMEKRRKYSIEEVFGAFDLDRSGSLSLKETLDLIKNVRITSHKDRIELDSFVDALDHCKQEKETFIEYLLRRFYWEIDRDTFLGCKKIQKFVSRMKGENLYKFETEDSSILQFSMLKSNLQAAVRLFKSLISTDKKFVCINNDLEETEHKTNDIIRGLQLQFYEDFFPKRSIFELSDQQFQDPINTKKRIRCKENVDHQKIYCLESTGKTFDVEIVQKKEDKSKYLHFKLGGSQLKVGQNQERHYPVQKRKETKLLKSKINKEPGGQMDVDKLGAQIRKN